MVARLRVNVLALVALFLVAASFFTSQPGRFGSFQQVFTGSQDRLYTASDIEALELREGLTILGDSYSSTTDLGDTWPNHVSEKTIQNLARSGAVIDSSICYLGNKPVFDAANPPNDLSSQVKKMTHYTKKVVIWFGVNDLMTFHVWPQDRYAGIQREVKVVLSLVDTLINAGVERIIIPEVIDFSDSPGLAIAREANQTAPRHITQIVIQDWNDLFNNEIRKRSKNVYSIGFQALSQQWQADSGFTDTKLRDIDASVEAYLWKDFLHLKPWVHQKLIAPHFEALL